MFPCKARYVVSHCFGVWPAVCAADVSLCDAFTRSSAEACKSEVSVDKGFVFEHKVPEGYSLRPLRQNCPSAGMQAASFILLVHDAINCCA